MDDYFFFFLGTGSRLESPSFFLTSNLCYKSFWWQRRLAYSSCLSDSPFGHGRQLAYPLRVSVFSNSMFLDWHREMARSFALNDFKRSYMILEMKALSDSSSGDSASISSCVYSIPWIRGNSLFPFLSLVVKLSSMDYLVLR